MERSKFNGINYIYKIALRFFGLSSSSYCYFHNVSANMSSGLLQVFVELRNLDGYLLKPRGSPVLIPFAITGYKC